MKLYKTNKDPELFYYFNAANEKMWMFRHRYYDSLGKRRERSRQGFKRENEAYRALLEVKTKTLNGDVKQVENHNLTVSEWFDIWYETHKNDWSISTQIQREMAIRRQIKPLLGKYKLIELNKTTYKRVFINELAKTLKPGTVYLLNRIFKTGINAAVDDEIIPRNRFSKIKVEKSKQLSNYLTIDELNIFLEAAKHKENITNYSIILLLAYTGFRRGEAYGLKWDDVSFDEKTISVNRTRDNKGSRKPKTPRSYRTILVDDLVLKQLKKYKSWCKQLKLSYGQKLKDDDYIFLSYQTGKPISEVTIKSAFERVLKDLKINEITPHGLRHTHATILINRGVPVTTIAERLGNTPQMIFDVYSHAFKEMEQESLKVFSNALNN